VILEIHFKKKDHSLWVTVRVYDAAELINAVTSGKNSWVVEAIQIQKGE